MMKDLANKTIFNIKPYVPGKPIEEVKRELGLKNVIKLASNENPYPPSQKVLKAISTASKNLNRYPDGNCFYLRGALAQRLKVSKRQLIFGNGSDEIIVLATRVFLKPSDEVIIAKPSFLVYDIASRIAGANVVEIPLKNFRYDLKGMQKAISRKTKIIFIGNPDNPAGTYISKKEMISFLESVPRHILIFVDEAYYEFVTSREYGSMIDYLDNYKNLIVTRTFSKMYGLAGLRVGYGVAHEEVMDLLNRVREPFNVNSLAQVAALVCLEEKNYYKRVAEKIEIERKRLYQNLKKLSIDFEESCTNFILLKLKKDGKVMAERLLKKGIIVRDMSYWGLNNYIRVTIGKRDENQKLLKGLKEVL